MRFAILSDIHANFVALEAVLGHAVDQQVDGYLFTGDLVVYGPQPNEVIERMQDLMGDFWSMRSFSGNNDSAIVRHLNREESATNEPARESYALTQKILRVDNKRILEKLPGAQSPDEAEPLVVNELITLFHGTIKDVLGLFTYMEQNDYMIKDSLRRLPTPLGIYGHTHVPAIYRGRPRSVNDLFFPYTRFLPEYDPSGTFYYSFDDLQPGERLLVNGGSVGQPRDGDPRAAYLIVDEEVRNLQFHRVVYNVAAVQDLMHRLGLPQAHIKRLGEGK